MYHYVPVSLQSDILIITAILEATIIMPFMDEVGSSEWVA